MAGFEQEETYGDSDRISGLDGLTGFEFGCWPAGVAIFGLISARDVEVGLGDLVPPQSRWESSAVAISKIDQV